MKMAYTVCVVFTLYLIVVLYGVYAAFEESKEDCISYKAKLTSMPDLDHRIVYQGRRHSNLLIKEVKHTNYQRSFYWCQLDIVESDNTVKRYRHFGYNVTHWWVEMGCGGWFIVTECKADDKLTIHQIIGVLDKALLPTVVYGSDGGSKISMNFGKGYTVIDELYKDWPKVGYRFPTSGKMWDVIDNATYVDVAEQMGFYNKFRIARSTIFD